MHLRNDARTIIYIYIYRYIYIVSAGIERTRNRSLKQYWASERNSIIRCAAINSDFKKIIISKYINYTIGINDNNCVFVCNLILGW